MANPKPLVCAAFICEKVLMEEGGIASAIRIVDTYRTVFRKAGSGPPPAQEGQQPSQIIDATTGVMQMSALVMLRAGETRGQHHVNIVIRKDGHEDAIPGGPYPIIFAKEDPTEAAIFNIQFVMPASAKSGLYWIDVKWDGETLTSFPLKLESQHLGSGEPVTK